MRSSRLLRASAIVAAAAVAAVVGFAPRPAGGADGASAFVGATACRRCHANEFAAWSTSAHALTMRPATAESLPPEAAAGGDVAHAPGRTVFAKSKSGVTATTPGDDGKPRAFSVDFVVGMRRLKMLVTRMDDGRCQVLPAMREEPSGPWFDYTHLLFGGPGTDARTPPVVKPGEPSFWTGPDRSFDARCARCHASGYEPRPTPPGGRGPRSAWRATGVDCEECHGPAGAHVAYWTDPHPDEAKDPLRVAKSTTDRVRALDACLECHLEGEPADAPSARGADVLEHVDPTLLDHDVRVDAAGRPNELIYEGLSFLASKCATAGRLVCRDCHDVHGGGARSSLVVANQRAPLLCAKCHGEIAAAPERHSRHPRASTATNCVGCHMPLLVIERGHGVVHDHSLGAPWPDEKAGAASRDACTGCHDGGRAAPADAPVLAPEVVVAKFRELWPNAKQRPCWAPVIAAGREARPGAADALEKLAADASTPSVVRASAAKLLGRFPEAALRASPFLASDRDSLVRRAALEGLATVSGDDADAALRRGLADTSAAVRSVAARAALVGWTRVQDNPDLLAAALPVLEQAARDVPLDHLRWFRLGAARQLAGDARGAVEAYERMLALDPASKLVREKVAKLRSEIGK